MKLTAENVDATYNLCLFEENETDRSEFVKGEGIRLVTGFHPKKLESQKQNIIDMLSELPDEFQQTKGGGMSFLNMCNDKYGRQWADLHQTMEKLVMLGNAVGAVVFLMPKEMWSVLPGGMPYLMVNSPGPACV
jgi:hypothetical protein